MCSLGSISRVSDVYVVLFFFQAEDGIRDLVRSRGLGDVYKRQVQYIPIAVLLGIALFFALLLPILSLSLGPKRLGQRALMPYESGMTPIGAVSYTHLTLPTSDLV